MIGAAALLRMGAPVLRQGWPFIMAGGVAAAIWLFTVMPLKADLSAVEARLSNERAAHLETQRALLAERSARTEATTRAARYQTENAALARRIDEERAAADAARNETASNSQRRIRDADADWSARPVPGRVGYELCLGLAAAAGGDGIHHAVCGDPPGDDGGAGR